ncbi:CrcB family protein [Apilactobacillus sp. TMW 2.2459]|uniref:fluoride efflux transporter FluC n=1 Tax=Apilactobacillus xinyiensis TaxID=2841032 RepID=UPI00200E0AD0|nr:CrcB family protein [Apilactobacillus xinyiensis]MCL0312519.1 CrcB family protein [Apilactobacillus xinyiensis]
MFEYVFIVGLGAAIGSVIRYIATILLNRLFANHLIPVSTIVINVTGSFILGWLTNSLSNSHFAFILMSSIIGGYTTFSTYMNETVQLYQSNKIHALLYYLSTIVLGILAATLGLYF